MNTYIYSALFIFINASYSLGQYHREWPPVEIRRCEGDTLLLWNYKNINNKSKTIYNDDCIYTVPYNVPNFEELVITGGPYIQTQEIVGDNTYANAYVSIKVIAEKSIVMTISTTQRIDIVFEGRRCTDAVSSTFKDTYTYVINVFPKKAPQLVSDKSVAQSGKEAVTFSVIGCDPLFCCVQPFSPSCVSPNPPSEKYGSGLPIGDFEKPVILSNSITYYVRCTDNNCYSDWSNPAHVEVIPTDNPCNDPDLDEVNKIRQEMSRIDNHYYTVETVICNKEGNLSCTRQKVFETLLSNKTYSTPIAGDLPAIPVIGSEALFKHDNSAVQRDGCATVNLPSASAIIANFLTLVYGVGTGNPFPYLFSHEATALNPIANPIGQYIDYPSFSVINYTKSTHVFHPGRVVRTVVEDCNSVKIVTNGLGNTKLGPTPWGQRLAEINKEQGENIFRNADQRVINAFNQLPK